MDLITSARNPLIKRIRRLDQRKHRREEGAFFVEGPRLFLAAEETGAAIDTVVYAPELLRSEACLAAVARLEAASVPVAALAAGLFARIAGRDRPPGIGAIVRARGTTLEALWPRGDRAGIVVALVEAADPGNVGTILRTIDAVSGAGLILAGQTTDPYHPTAVKASMGAIFTVPVAEVDGPAPVLAWARSAGLQIVATSAHAPLSLWQAPLRRPLLLLMGSERHGLDAATLASADLAVTIPMQGEATSLNLGVATAVLLYEVFRREP